MKKIFLLLSLIFSVLTFSQNRFEKIDEFLSYLNQNNKFMGSLSIREGDNVVFSKAYGFANVDEKLSADKETKYKIGSITKTFTAVMTMQLIEEKKLRLETKLAKFFPKVKNAELISIDDLLHQRTGIKDFLNADSTIIDLVYKKNSTQDIVDKIASYESLFEPNSKYEYSNSNYYLLGCIIEKITKKTYAENLEQRIVKKIGLKNTYFSFENIDSSNKESHSYLNNGEQWTVLPEVDNSLLFATGGIISTPNDLTAFLYELFEGKLVKKSSLESMKDLKESYGKALIQFPFGERKFYGHNGIIDGFKATAGYYPTEKLGISLLINGENYNQNDIMIGILSIYYKLPFPFPSFDKINPETIKVISGTYSSNDLPLKISIFEKNGELLAQATGQSSFPLTQKDEKTFIFPPARIEIEFGESTLILKQAGQKFNFNKE